MVQSYRSHFHGMRSQNIGNLGYFKHVGYMHITCIMYQVYQQFYLVSCTNPEIFPHRAVSELQSKSLNLGLILISFNTITKGKRKRKRISTMMSVDTECGEPEALDITVPPVSAKVSHEQAWENKRIQKNKSSSLALTFKVRMGPQ